MNQPALTSRPYARRDDLREMESIVSEAWAGPARPLVTCAVGDLEWWVAGAGPDVDLAERVRLWSLGSRLVAWGWFKPAGSLDLFVRPDVSVEVDAAVRDDMTTWFRELAHLARVDAVATEPAAPDPDQARPADPVLLDVWGHDGRRDSTWLRDRGWMPTDHSLTQYFQSLDRPIEEATVPDGYRVRTIAGPEEIAARVEVHRAAFAPSKLTIAKYELLVHQEHYRFDRDVVVEAPDGSFASFTMCWYDPAGRIGEFEPVGTHPDHRRRGLGRAANLLGLRILQEAGSPDAMVFSFRSNAASEALYRSVGFREIGVHRAWTTPLDG